MCGIAGFIDFRGKSNIEILKKMTDSLQHRGPDDGGIYFDELNNYQIGFGHRRLSILDLSNNGHQPMFTPDKDQVIVYNGEIYNFNDIRKELQDLGIKFKSQTDTEVILYSYLEWGIKCFDKFVGMFSFALYDARKNEIIIVRDRAGIKPLYYYYKDGLFLFSSELKSFHAHPFFSKTIDFNSLNDFLMYGYTLTPHTIFKNTHKLRPGHFLKILLDKQDIKENIYWDVSTFYNKPKLSISFDDAQDEVERLLKSACEYRMVSDVPVGVFLSGGYDSSAVTALLQKDRGEKIKTFSIGYKEAQFNEAQYAKQVAQFLGTEHYEYYCTSEDAAKLIPEIPYYFDEPFADASAIPTMLVSALARKHVTVSLSADAGDEIFAGYGKYQTFINYYKRFEAIPSIGKKIMHAGLSLYPKNSGLDRWIYNDMTRVSKVGDLLVQKSSIEDYLKILSQHFGSKELNHIVQHKNSFHERHSYFSNKLDKSFNDDLNSILAVDYNTYLLDDILTKIDRATMSVSLEGREPLLDHRIIEFVAQLPSYYKYDKNIPKIILKNIVHKYIPKAIMDRPKMGFGVPIELWLKDELKELLMYYFDEKRIGEQGIFNVKSISKIKNGYIKGRKMSFQKIWALLVFQMWYEKWMN